MLLCRLAKSEIECFPNSLSSLVCNGEVLKIDLSMEMDV